MNLRATILPGQMGRKPLVALGFLALVAYAAYRAAGLVIEDDLQSLSMVGLAVVGGAGVITILNNWRNGLYIFLTWLLFEDFVRKYLGNNMAIFFGKDLLVLVVYLSFYLAIRRRRDSTFRPPFLIPVLIFVWFGVAQVFNPESTSIWFGLLGVKVYFLYMPLVLVGYALLDTEVQLRRFFTLNIVLGLFIVSLGIAQSILGHTFLNPQSLDADIEMASKLYRVSPISGVMIYRPCATFVSHGRYADFLIVMWLVVLGFSGYLLLRHRRGRWLAFLTLGVTAAGSVMSGARGVIMWSLINAGVASIAFLWGAPWRRGEVARVLRNVQRLVLGAVLAGALLFLVFPDALGARLSIYAETLLPSSSASELTLRTWDYPMRNFLGAFDNPRWPYGNGIGTASLGMQYVTRIFKVRPLNIGVESGFGTLVLEVGVGGLVLWLVMAGAILTTAFRVVLKLRGSPWFPLGFVIFWYAFVLLILTMFAGMQAYEDFLMNAYLWLLLGVLFRLPTLGQEAQQAAIERAALGDSRWMR